MCDRSGSPEDDRPVPVEQDPVLEVPTQTSGEHGPLDVPADPQEFADVIGVVDSGGVLLDDGTFVKVGGHIVTRGADQFDSPLEGLGGMASLRQTTEGSCGGY